MKYSKLTLFAIAGAAVACGAFVTAPAVAAVDGPAVTWKFNVWGKKRAFTADVEA